MSEEGKLPRWLKVANPLIVALQRRGMVIGTVRLLSIPGRKNGKPQERQATHHAGLSADRGWQALRGRRLR
jgi:hypothetical protein